jgi:UDP-N-acetylmuramate dehydrogenase
MLPEENKLLAPFTTFGIGGPARWFVAARTEEEISEADAWVRDRGLPLFVLGGGSNVLISDGGFNGLVLKVALRGVIRAEERNSLGRTVYQVAAGEDWDEFVERAVVDNCAGIECLAGIPGTVGGTPVQNVGAYGQEVSSTIARVRAFDRHLRTFVEFSSDECGFAYRRSRFNSVDRERYIVTRVDYQMTPGGEPTLRYADLQRSIPADRRTNLTEVAAVVRQIRRSKGMLLVEGEPDCHSAGSFFKNPVVSEEQLHSIHVASAKEPPCFPAGPGPENAGRVKVPAAWLIEQAGFAKGYSLGAAGVSSRHTLALVNRGGATADEILQLARAIMTSVRNQFGIQLEIEPVLVGLV